MGRDDVRAALEAMAADDSLLDAVAAGDVEALDLGGLTADERAIVAAAADDWPEVAGFDMFDFGPKKIPLNGPPNPRPLPPMQGPQPKPADPPMGPHPKPSAFETAHRYGFGW